MHLRPLLPLLPLLLALSPGVAGATNVVVPDQYATIQGGLDSGADTVYIKAGTYAETVVTPVRSFWLVGFTPDSGWGHTSLAMPLVKAITTDPHSNVCGFHGLRIQGPLSLQGYGTLDLVGCWLEAGVTVSISNCCRIWNNVIVGDVNIPQIACGDIAMNTVHGGIHGFNPPGDSYIHDNFVVGPAPVGIEVSSDVSANRNRVQGCTIGIRLLGMFSGATGNVVEDCSGAGIFANNRQYNVYPISGNTVRRSMRGIELHSSDNVFGSITGNTIESSYAEGIYARTTSTGTSWYGELAQNVVRDAGGTGIDVTGCFTNVSGNRVYGSGADGLVTGTTGQNAVVRNIVGHSRRRGIVATGPGSVSANTSFLNGWAGFDLTTSTSVDHNISYGNEREGLKWTGAPTNMGCNDWYANAGGNVVGATPWATDVSLDPLFCDAASNDVGLMSGSPLASLGGCGLVGALGVGCTVSAVLPATAVETVAFAVMPTPTVGAVRFAWRAPGGGELAIYDVAGQRRWARALDGDSGTLAWDGSGRDGRPLAPGVYFARLMAGGHTATRRVVLAP